MGTGGRRRRLLVAVALIGVAVAVGSGIALVAGAGDDETSPVAKAGGPTAQVPLKKASFDSDAPPGAPAHWLPPEDWVYNHWLPYDEGRLYALLHATRGDIWRQLRDDHHNLAELAARKGWPDPRKLAAALVAPRRSQVSAQTFAELQSRALRTITQGHMAQHLFFHSLHQFAIPSEAPEIFGVTDAEFRSLRRGEQSPLEIGRLHGRSPARIQALAADVLRERLRFGVRSGATTKHQAAILLRRQISQLPRWLAQVRYNGPPPTHAGKLTSKPRDYAANPALSADGRRVVFEAYQQKLPLALKQGEISVRSQPLPAGREVLASFEKGRRTPRSAYNATASRDGRFVAYEAAEGNLNFAKRYGQIHVFVFDAKTGRTQRIAPVASGTGLSKSEYNPAISANGRRLAYQAVSGRGASQVYVTDLRSGRATLASRAADPRGANLGAYDPSISGDGTKVAFSSAASNLGAGTLRGRTQVFVRDLRARTTTLVSRAGGSRGAIADDYSTDPAISANGQWVAFTTAARNFRYGPAGGSRAYMRHLPSTALFAAGVASDGFALKPSVSDDGRVAFTAISHGRGRVVVADRERGTLNPAAKPARVVSRATGATGAEADGSSADASISADGRRVAFSSTATNLSPQKTADTRAVFVRDVGKHTTKLVSAPALAPAQGAAAAKPATGPVSAPAAEDTTSAALLPRSSVVSIFDNAFHRGSDRPVVRLERGGVLTWRWRSQQSHQVTLRSGPQGVKSPTQTAGAYSVRLLKPGTYEFVCSIHAPGMTMTAQVR